MQLEKSLACCISLIIVLTVPPIQSYPISSPSPPPKLLILAVDGFRWDYYKLYKKYLPNLRKFIAEGLQASYVNPIFPSLTYPSMTSILTGLHPSSHQVIGNYMLHLEDDQFPEETFELRSNKKGIISKEKVSVWAYYAGLTEPFWITATKAGRKTYVSNFPYCNIPHDHIVPTECTEVDPYANLTEQFTEAVARLSQEGYSLAMIYHGWVDHAAHYNGIESDEFIATLLNLDTALRNLVDNVNSIGLQNELNIVIVSDHGMVSLKDFKYVKLTDYISDYLDDIVYKVVDYGAVVSIALVNHEKTDLLYLELRRMPGVNVYRKHDIPDKFHYKEGKFVLDILLVAKPGYFIVGLSGNKQIPNEPGASMIAPFKATHGFYNMEEMRTIFYAKGPAFKTRAVVPKIELVDEYLIFTHVLGVEPCPNNGTFDNVITMFN